MSITFVQILQTVVGCMLGFTIVNVKLNGGTCHHKWDNLYLAIAIYVIHLWLFARYFYFVYIIKATSRKILTSPVASSATELNGRRRRSSPRRENDQSDGRIMEDAFAKKMV